MPPGPRPRGSAGGLERLFDRVEIARFLRRDAALNLYSLGDLDDFFWPHTTYYGFREGSELRAIVLVYEGVLTTVLALCRPEEAPPMRALVRELEDSLPPRFYAHLSPGLEELLRRDFRLEPHGEHLKMAWKRREAVREVEVGEVVRVSPEDLADVLAFYRESYPGNWFDARMLETNQYFGVRRGGAWACIGGVHVFSEPYRAAALGNIATRPDLRGRGLARAVVARLCRSLEGVVDHVGLNVKADNAAALACYRRLGFEVVASFGEFMVERRATR